MDKSFWFFKNAKQAIFYVMVALMIVGCINVFSASYIKAFDESGDSFAFLKRYILFAIISVGAMVGTRKIGYKRLLQPETLFTIYMSVAFMLMAVFLFSDINGAHRWIKLPFINIQPSEIAKLVMIMISASSLGNMLKHGSRISLTGGRSVKIICLTLIYFALIYFEPDLGTAAIVMGLVLGMFIIAGLPKEEIVAMMGLAAVAGVALAFGTEYRRARMAVLRDPWSDAMGSGYQMVQSQLAIGSGGLFGTRWGQGTGKFFYLPEAHTDFAFAIFSQENGYIGVILLFIAFVILGAACARIAVRAQDEQGFLLVSGVSFLVVGQALANMIMVGGMLPVIGVPLTFISYGGSSMLISMVGIGLLLSVYDEEVKREKRAELTKEVPENLRHELQFTSSGRWKR